MTLTTIDLNVWGSACRPQHREKTRGVPGVLPLAGWWQCGVVSFVFFTWSWFLQKKAAFLFFWGLISDPGYPHGSEPSRKDGRIPLRNGAISFKNPRTPLYIGNKIKNSKEFSLSCGSLAWNLLGSNEHIFASQTTRTWFRGFKVIREGMDSSLLKASQDRNYITSSGHSRKSNFHAPKTSSSPLRNTDIVWGDVPFLDLPKMFPTCLVLFFLGLWLWRCFRRGITSKHLPSQGKQFWAQDSSKFSHWGGGSREIWLAGYFLNGLLQDQNRASDFLIPPPTKIGARK